MSAGQGWIVRPIFITSTFRDLHAECDLLRDRGLRAASFAFASSLFPIPHIRPALTSGSKNA